MSIYKRDYYTEAPDGMNTAILEYDDDGNFSSVVSICLIGYGHLPKENQIFIPAYKFSEEAIEKYKKDLAKKVIKTVKIGPFDSECLLLELKDDWKETIKEA